MAYLRDRHVDVEVVPGVSAVQCFVLIFIYYWEGKIRPNMKMSLVSFFGVANYELMQLYM